MMPNKNTDISDISDISHISIRPAVPTDAAAITACVNAAYAKWIPIIGQTPGPMLADYAAVIKTEAVFVAEQVRANVARFAGVLVLSRTDEGFLLDNIAVQPDFAGLGVGKALLLLAEAQAAAGGYDSIYLYTHEKMTENIALYAKNGYVEYARREEHGFKRVFMRKTLA